MISNRDWGTILVGHEKDHPVLLLTLQHKNNC